MLFVGIVYERSKGSNALTIMSTTIINVVDFNLNMKSYAMKMHE